MIGKTVAHYKIVEMIGAGGMGEVFRASDSKLGRDVALKMLPAAFTHDAERMARFQREAQVLASLNHPNIGAIYGLEERDGAHFLVLELIDGPTLFDRLRTGNIPVSEALEIARQIAEAVEYAHESGVVHRDLKPANVKVTEDGRVKVLDFGLAKAMEDPAMATASGVVDASESPTLAPTLQSPITGALTAANVILGTAAYMSPEQARGKPVDKRADIWSFGVMLWEMLTAQRLFDGETVSDTLAAVLRKEPEWTALPASTPPRIERLVRRCLERNPKERLRDIGDARISIEEVLGGDVGDEVDATSTPAPGARRWAVMGVGVAIAAAVAFAGGWWLGQSPETSLPLRKFVVPVSDAMGGVSANTMLAITLDGSRIAYTSEGSLWVRDLNRLEPHKLAGTDGATRPFWSPDGEWVAYGSGSKLWKVPTAGGKPTAICELSEPFSIAAGGVWRADGEIVFCDGDGPLLTVSSQGGDPDTLLPMNAEFDLDFHAVASLPNDQGYVFVVHGKDGDYDRIDVLADGVRQQVITHDGQPLSRPAYSPSGHLLYHRESSNEGIWAVPFSLDELRTTGKPFLAIADGEEPHVAADGTLIHWMAAQSRTMQILIVDRVGGVRTAVGQAQEFLPTPALSPDGTRVAIPVSGEEIDLWILDVERGTQSRLTFEPGRELAPAWSPDGKRIYYHSGQTVRTFTLKMRAADGTGTAVDLGPGGGAAVSPDGRFLFYNIFAPEGLWDIWYVPIDVDGLPSSDAMPFMQTDAFEFSGRLSPDGSHVAYVSSETGRFEVYLTRFPGGDGKWQVTVDGGSSPRWSPDGSELFFMSNTDVYMVPVQTHPSVSLGTPRVHFSREGNTGAMPAGLPDLFDVALDGRFAIVEPVAPDIEDPSIEGLVVTQNWFAEFQTED